MSTPIKREDIRKGDRIRIKNEFTSDRDYGINPNDNATYELIERPMVLPTAPGYYESEFFPVAGSDSKSYSPYRLDAYGEWHLGPSIVHNEYIRSLMPLRRLKFAYDE